MKKRWIALALGAAVAAGAGLHRGQRFPFLAPPLTIHSGGRVEKLTLSPDGRLLADDTPLGQVLLYDTATGQQRYAFAVRTDRMVFSPDGRRLLTQNMRASPTNPNGTIQVWDTATGAQLSRFVAPVGTGAAPDIAALSRDLRWAVVRAPGRCTVYDIATGNIVKALLLPAGKSQVALSPDHGLLATGGGGAAGKLQVWGTKTWQPLLPVGTQVSGISGIRFSPDGSRLALGSPAGLAWRDTHTWKQTGRFPLPSPGGLSRAFFYFSSDSRSLLVSQTDPTDVLHQVDCATGRETLTVAGQLLQHVSLTGDRGAACIMPGKYQYILFRDTYCVWDTARRRVLYQVPVPPSSNSSLMGDFQPHSADLSADGHVFTAGGCDDGVIRIWRLP